MKKLEEVPRWVILLIGLSLGLGIGIFIGLLWVRSLIVLVVAMIMGTILLREQVGDNYEE